MFVDGGWGSYSFVPYVISDMGLSYDAMLIDTIEAEAEERIEEQNSIVVGNPQDTNGALLYPDGSPRYRLIFVNGNGWISHGTSLGEEGRERYRTFYYNGGSYTGSCAGAFFATQGHVTGSGDGIWLGIWPGKVNSAGLGGSWVFDDLEHPLVNKYPSLRDGVVKNVEGGAPSFGDRYGTRPPGTEWLGKADISGYNLGYLHYSNPDIKEKEEGWMLIAYKTDQNSGRLVLSSGHPEYSKEPEVMDLTAAIYEYSLDGTRPIPRLKGELENGVLVDMSSEESAVGDKQYHRWMINLPQDVSELVIRVEGLTQDANLYLNEDCPAHRHNAQHRAENPGSLAEEIVVENPACGPWHLSVYGNHDQGNGTPYVLTATWHCGSGVCGAPDPANVEDPPPVQLPYEPLDPPDPQDAESCTQDPDCGLSCGTCSSGQRCNSWGECVPESDCVPVSPTVVDSVGMVGRSNSLAVDDNGGVHISYYDWIDGDVRYATNVSGNWESETVDSQGDVGYYTSLGVDRAGRVYIAYWDWTNRDLKVATKSSGTWQVTIVDDGDMVGRFPSLAIDSQDRVHIGYMDWTNYDLRYATKASGDWASWELTTVDSEGSVGQHTTLAVDSAGAPHICYHDSTDYDLKHATNTSGTWEKSFVESQRGQEGIYSSMAIDGNGSMHISYYRKSISSYLKYSTNASGIWETTYIENQGEVHSVYTSLAVDVTGRVYIGYYDDTNRKLKVATNGSGSWQTIIVDSQQWDVGSFSSLAVDSSGRVHMSYYDGYNKDLKYVALCP
jgi:hypothetical protein